MRRRWVCASGCVRAEAGERAAPPGVLREGPARGRVRQLCPGPRGVAGLRVPGGSVRGSG